MPGTVGHVPPAPAAPPGAQPSAATLAENHPWHTSPLGPRQGWDGALRTVVDVVLASPVAMAVACGEQLNLIYNDAYALLLGPRHPTAFGQPAATVFADTWHLRGVGDVLTRVVRTGQAHLAAETSPTMSTTAGDGGGQHDGAGPVADVGRLDRAGPTPLHPAFTSGHSPVRDAAGQVIGVLTVVAENTQVTRRLHHLTELTSALAGTLTLDDVARVTLRYAASSFEADQVAFAVDDGAGWRTVRRLRGDLLDEADERLPPVWRRQPADSPAPLARVAASGLPEFVADGAPLAATATDRHDQKVRALAALPMRTPSLTGAVTVGYRSPHAWTPAERALLTTSAQLVAQAAERARRFENQHGTAQLLQRSMLPEHLPDLPRLRIAARYEPGVDGNAAGGDFYDAFMLPDGRLGVVLGDVAGHDVQAAALMGQVRAALRAVALGEPDPAVVLPTLDRLVVSLESDARSNELFVTVVYAVVDPDGQRVTVASAGHPAPLLRRADPASGVTARYLDVPAGPPLGLGGRRAPVTVDFPPGDMLLLFSDGVVERRQQPLSVGLATLASAVAGAGAVGGDPRTLCAVAASAVAGSTDDDVAVLAVEHARTPSRSAGIEVPAEPTAPSRVRHWLTAQLTQWRVPEQVIGAAVLCTSELTTNALLHAGTAARVEIDLSPDRLLVSVADRGTRGTVVRARTDALSSRGRGLGLIDELSDAWGTDPTVRGSTVWFEMLIPTGDGPESPVD